MASHEWRERKVISDVGPMVRIGDDLKVEGSQPARWEEKEGERVAKGGTFSKSAKYKIHAFYMDMHRSSQSSKGKVEVPSRVGIRDHTGGI